jgi:hypothetical protein
MWSSPKWGRTFVEEARLALLHIDRAVQLGHAAREGSDSILTIGHSPDADQAWLRPNPPIANAPAGKRSGPRGRSAPAHLVDREIFRQQLFWFFECFAFIPKNSRFQIWTLLI